MAMLNKCIILWYQRIVNHLIHHLDDKMKPTVIDYNNVFSKKDMAKLSSIDFHCSNIVKIIGAKYKLKEHILPKIKDSIWHNRSKINKNILRNIMIKYGNVESDIDYYSKIIINETFDL